jgi:large subunit ribosomal protein L9
MSKRLQVVLNKNVPKLGSEGSVIEVAPGYARNYLIPQGLGTLATPGILRQVEYRQEKERQRLLAIREEAKARKQAIETIGRLTIRKQVGEGEAIFGTVTAQDVADAIQAATKQEIDRRGITLPEISQTGFYKASLKLHPEVTAEIEIQVAPL